MIQIYHNPRCGKSRNCVAFIEAAGKEYQIIRISSEKRKNLDRKL